MSFFARLVSFSILCTTTLAQQRLPSTAHALIFSATADFRHDSIPTAIQAMTSIGPQYNIQFNSTEDQTWFKDGRINGYDALIFLDNTGEGVLSVLTRKPSTLTVQMNSVLDDDAERAFENYINSGGNFVGIHAASDCQRNSTFFGNELGELSKNVCRSFTRLNLGHCRCTLRLSSRDHQRRTYAVIYAVFKVSFFPS